MVDYAKLKTNLNLIIHRLKLVEKKKIELNQKARRQIGEFLNTGKVDRARIRVEQIIREDYLIEAMDILESYCDLILSRFGQLQSSSAIDDGLQTAISSIIWIAPRLESDVSELKAISEQLGQKYGKQYVAAARENQLRTVNETLMRKMCVQAPPKVLVEKYLVEIAKDQKIDYKADPRILKEHEASSPGGNSSGHNMNTSSSSNDDIDDLIHRGGGGSGGGGGGGSTNAPQSGFNLINLGDHYPAAPAGQPGSSGQAPPLPKEQPHGFTTPKNNFDPTESPSAPTGLVPIGFNLNSLLDVSEPSTSGPGLMPVSKPSGINKNNSGEGPPPNYETVMNNSLKNSSKSGLPNTSSASIKPGSIPDSGRIDLNDTLPELPSVPAGLPDITETSINQTSAGGHEERLDFEDLARRFEELKNRK